MDAKKCAMMYMKRYVRDVMMMRQALIFEGLSEDELDEAIREESVKSMKEYGAMTKMEFYIETLLEKLEIALQEKHPSETE